MWETTNVHWNTAMVKNVMNSAVLMKFAVCRAQVNQRIEESLLIL